MMHGTRQVLPWLLAVALMAAGCSRAPSPAGVSKPAPEAMAAGTPAAAAPAAAANCGTLVVAPAAPNPEPRNFPLLAGKVAGIEAGCLRLSDVSFGGPPSAGRPEPLLQLPAGRWLDGRHWQSDDRRLDLWRGDPVGYYSVEHRLVPGLQYAGGIVRSAADGLLSLETRDGIPGNPSTWQQPKGSLKLRLAPYSATLDEQGKPAAPGAGQRVLVSWFGPPEAAIAWKIVVLGDDRATKLPAGIAPGLVKALTDGLRHRLTQSAAPTTPDRTRVLAFRFPEISVTEMSPGDAVYTVMYSVLPTVPGGSDWRAGNGIISADGWVRDKEAMLRAVPEGDGYRLSSGLP